jgi:hypothetical protein
MILNRVTMTGADDSTDPKELINLSKKYPFVEWGILLSKSSEGRYRFPSLKWIEQLKELSKDNNINLAGHLCGRWVNDIMLSNESFFEERKTINDMFQRIQLNFHGFKTINYDYINNLKKYNVQYIFQIDNINNHLFENAIKEGVNAVPLFDMSHGAGVSPDSWPKPYSDVYNGYAGGIGPNNIIEEIKRIGSNVPENTVLWIDMESKIRSYNDSMFDLFKVEDCLEKAAPFVKKS